MTDLVDAHRRTLETSIAIVASMQVADLGRPTPCGGWDLRALLAHMIGQNYGFAAAAEGDGGDLTCSRTGAVGADPAGEYAASAGRAIEAFGAPGVLERDVEVAVLRGGVTLPGGAVIGCHLVDYVVHGWDVAKTLGVPAAVRRRRAAGRARGGRGRARAGPQCGRGHAVPAVRRDRQRGPARPDRRQPRPIAGLDARCGGAVMSEGGTTLVTGIGELVTNDPAYGDGSALGLVRDAAVVVQDGAVAWVGSAAEAPDADERRRPRRPRGGAGLRGQPRAPGLRGRPGGRVRGPDGRGALHRRRASRRRSRRPGRPPTTSCGRGWPRWSRRCAGRARRRSRSRAATG